MHPTVESSDNGLAFSWSNVKDQVPQPGINGLTGHLLRHERSAVFGCRYLTDGGFFVARNIFFLPPELHPHLLLTEQQTALLTCRGVQTLRNDRRYRRGLPYVRLGRSIRYQLADVLTYIEVNRIKPEADNAA